MSKDTNFQRTLGMTLSGGIAGGIAASALSSWTTPITERRTLHGVSGGGPAQGIIQGAPAATRTKSAYSYQRENPKKKWADAITGVVGMAGSVAANMLLPGSGAATNAITGAAGIAGGVANAITAPKQEPLSAFSSSILRGEIDPITGQPVGSNLGSFKLNAPTNIPSILSDNTAIKTNGYMDILGGYVDPRYTGFLSDGLENSPLLKNWNPNTFLR